MQPTIDEFDCDQADSPPFNNNELMRKTSDPPQLKSRQDFFSSLKLGIQCPNFSAGNVSDEPHSAASFSAIGLGNSPENNYVDAD